MRQASVARGSWQTWSSDTSRRRTAPPDSRAPDHDGCGLVERQRRTTLRRHGTCTDSPRDHQLAGSEGPQQHGLCAGRRLRVFHSLQQGRTSLHAPGARSDLAKKFEVIVDEATDRYIQLALEDNQSAESIKIGSIFTHPHAAFQIQRRGDDASPHNAQRGGHLERRHDLETHSAHAAGLRTGSCRHCRATARDGGLCHAREHSPASNSSHGNSEWSHCVAAAIGACGRIGARQRRRP